MKKYKFKEATRVIRNGEDREFRAGDIIEPDDFFTEQMIKNYLESGVLEVAE